MKFFQDYMWGFIRLLKTFWGHETKNIFEYSNMNGIMIVLIKLYSSTIPLNQKSLKLMMKNPLSLLLLPSCR